MNKRLLSIFFALSFCLSYHPLAAQCPTLNGFLVDACGDSNYEGMNEMVVFHTGTVTYDLNQLSIDWPALGSSGGGNLFAPTNGFCIEGNGCPTPITALTVTSDPSPNNGFTTNSGRVAWLNSQIVPACPSGVLLFSPTSNIIPADATVIVFAGGACWPEPFASCYFPYNFAPLCGQGPIYVIFRNDCIGQGKFRNDNSGSSPSRQLILDFGSVQDGCNTTLPCADYDVTYPLPSSGNDGNGIVVGSSGVSVGTLQDYNCAPPGFIPSTGNGCIQNPPTVSPVQICGTLPASATVDVTSVPTGVNLQWFSVSTGGSPIGTTTSNSPDFTFNFVNTNSLWVQTLDPSPAGCSPSCRLEVPVSLLTAPAGSFTPNIAGCQGTPLTLTATITAGAPVTYSWYIESPSGIDETPTPFNTNPLTFTPSGTGDYLICLEITSANNCSTTICNTQPIDNATTVIVSSPDPSICAGETLQLNVVGGASFVWTGPNSFSSNLQNPSIPNASTAAQGTYSVITTNAAGCTAAGSINITVGNAPPASAGAAIVACSGNNISLSANGGVGYQWSGPNGFNSNLQSPALNAVSTNATGTYIVTVTALNGCRSTASQNVTINASPQPQSGGNISVCAGSNVPLSASGGTTYQWSGPNAFSSNLQNPTINNATVAANGTYFVTVSNANCSAVTSQNVTINSVPNALTGNPITICQGANINLLANGGTSYQWSGPNAFSSNLQNPSIVGATTNMAGAYTVVVTSANGCTDDATQNVTVNASPTANIAVSGPTTFCTGGSVTLTASGGNSYLWSNGTTTTAGAALSVNQSGNYTVVVTGTGNCTASAQQAVTVNPNPTANITALSPTTFCTGGSVTLTASGGNSYLWSNGTTTTAGAALSVNQSGNYTVVVTGTGGCTASAQQAVTVNTLPNAIANTLTPSVCTGGSILLQAVGGTSYQWSGPNNYSSNAQNPTINNATAAMQGTYIVTVTSANTCANTASVAVVVGGLPSPNITGSTSFCAGGNTQLSTSGGTSYQWQLNGSNIAGATNAQITAASAGTYTVIVSNGAGCTASAQHVLTQNPQPNPTISGQSTICNDGSSTLLMATGGTTYQWFQNGNLIPGATSNTFSTGIGGTLYSVVVSDANACTGVSAGFLVLSINPIDATTIPPPTSLCNNNLAGNTIELDLTTLEVGTIGGTWTTNAPNGTIINQFFDAENLAAGVYTLTYTVQSAPPCAPSVTTQNINVIFCPPNCSENAVFNAPPTLCGASGNTLDLNTLFTATTTTGGTWSSNAPNGTISGLANFDANGLSGNYNIVYTTPGLNGCPQQTFTTQITVVAPPDAATNAPTQPLCNTGGGNTTLNLSSLVTGNANGVWTCPQASAAISGDVFNATGLAPGNYTIIYTVTAQLPCTGNNVSNQTLVVTAPQNTVLNQSTCANTYVLDASAAGATGSGSWSNTGALAATIANPNQLLSNVTLNGGQGNYSFVWTPTNPSPCLNTVNINLNFAQSGAFAGNDVVICGPTYTFGANGTNGSWTYTGAGIASFSNPSSPTSSVTVSDYGAYTFTWTLTSGACTGNDNVVIFFFPEPTADPTPATTTPEQACGLSYNLSAYALAPNTALLDTLGAWISATGNILSLPPADCQWGFNGPAGATATFASNATTPEVTVTVSMYGTYEFFWTCEHNDFLGCGEGNVLTVEFLPQPSASIAINCVGNNTQYEVILTLSSAIPPYTFNNTNSNSSTYTEVFQLGQAYSISFGDNGPCEPQTIGGTSPNCGGCPFVPVPVFVNTSFTYCDPTVVPTISVQQFLTYAYYWYETGNATPIQTGGTTFTPPGPGDYYVQSVVVADSCTSVPLPFTVSLLPGLPNPVAVPATFCQNSPSSVVATALPGATLYWMSTDGSISGQGSSFSPPTDIAGAFTFDLWQEANGCESGFSSVTITIDNCNVICPTLVSVTQGAAACTTGNAPISITLDDPNGTLDHIELLNPFGVTMITGTNTTMSANVSSTGIITGCDPLTINYSFEVYCTDDPSTPALVIPVPVTFYPQATATISTPDGCTAIAIPDCPNFSIVGSNTQTSAGGNQQYTFTLQNDAAIAAGVVNACAMIPSGFFDCPIVACPTAPDFQVEICNGDTVALNLSNIANQGVLQSIQWLDPSGNVIAGANTTSLPNIALGNTGCDPVSTTYTCQLFCANNNAVPSDEVLVTLTSYPTFDPSFINFIADPECDGPPTFQINGCNNYNIVPVSIAPATPGINTASWQVTYSAGGSCIDTLYTYLYLCPDCFEPNNLLNETLSLCDGQQPDWASLESSITITDPNLSFDQWQWFADAALTLPITPANTQYQGDFCQPYQTILYLGGICSLPNAGVIPGGELNLTIYPPFDPTQISSVAGDCALPTLQVNCPNYIATPNPATMPTLPITQSGSAQWTITYSDASGFPSCFSQTIPVPYFCDDTCPVVSIDQDLPSQTCSGESITLSLTVLPNSALLGTDYMVQWQQNGVDITGATSMSFNATMPTTDCALLNETYSVVVTCLIPGGQPPVIVQFANTTVHPSYSAANIVITNNECVAPSVLNNCANYTITGPTPPIVPGGSGTATWTVSSQNNCFADQDIEVGYFCPQCPQITALASETESICSSTVLAVADFEAVEQTVTYTDPDNYAAGFAWYSDAALTQPLTPADYQHSGSCAVETFTLYLALQCNTGTQQAAGTFAITVYPVPTTAAAAGACSLLVNDNCLTGNLVIEYLNGGVWSTNAPNPQPLDGETADWRAFVAGADIDGDGTPECMQTGTVTAQSCNCTAPAAPTAVNANLSVCENTPNTTAFEVNVPSGVFVIWFDNNSNPLDTGSTYLTTTAGTYFAQAFSTVDTCAGGQITATLTLNNSEDMNFDYGGQAFCLDDPASLPTVSNVLAGTYSTNDNITVNANTGEISFTEAGTFDIIFTPTNACDTGDTTSVTVVDCTTCTPPNPPTAAGNDSLMICAGAVNTQAFSVTSEAGTIVVWFNAQGDSIATGNSYVPLAAGTYSAQTQQANDPTCVSANVPFVLTEMPLSTLLVDAGTNISVCEGEAINLQGSLSGGQGALTWISADGGSFGNASSLTSAFVPNGAGDYALVLTAQASGACAEGGQDTVLVTVLPQIIVSVAGDDHILTGDSTLLTASGASNYTWLPTESLSCADCASPFASPLETTTYTVNTTDACSTPTEFTVFIDAPPPTPTVFELLMPNAFSPNGDGQNDRFTPIYSSALSSYRLTIYNRWGNLVFDSADPTKGWDGTFKGMEQEVDVYVYWVSYQFADEPDAQEQLQKGNLTLVR